MSNASVEGFIGGFTEYVDARDKQEIIVIDHVDDNIRSLHEGGITCDDLVLMIDDYADSHDMIGNGSDAMAKYAVALFAHGFRHQETLILLMWCGLVPLHQHHLEAFAEMLKVVDFVCSHGSDFFNEYSSDGTMEAVMFLLDFQAQHRPDCCKSNLASMKELYTEDPDYGYEEEERVVTEIETRYSLAEHCNC